MEDNLCIVIMAGGKGTRFWPKSTEEKPKQFLSLIDEKTMLQLTYERAKMIVPEKNIFINTGTKYIELVKSQIPEIDAQNIIEEPYGRNTAPCIDLACEYVKQLRGDINLALIPSDHLVKDAKKFKDYIVAGNRFLSHEKSAIVTIGITPNRPETGYGYIKLQNPSNNSAEISVEKVERFVEKPNLETAREYLLSGQYLWNAGMFIFNVDEMLKEFQKNAESIYNVIHTLPPISDVNYNETLQKEYQNCENISVDYAIMEKSDSVYVVPADFGWDDIGTWKSLERYADSDEDENIFKGNVVKLNSKNCVVYAENKKVILVDVDDLYVIEGENEIVVCKNTSTDKIRDFREE